MLTQRWVEGNDKVKVLSAIGHQTLHRLFAIVESDDYADVQALFTDQMWNDPIEVLPVNDRLLRGKTSENGPSNYHRLMDKNVDKRANVSLGQNERLVRCRHESLKKAVLEEPMVRTTTNSKTDGSDSVSVRL